MFKLLITCSRSLTVPSLVCGNSVTTCALIFHYESGLRNGYNLLVWLHFIYLNNSSTSQLCSLFWVTAALTPRAFVTPNSATWLFTKLCYRWTVLKMMWNMWSYCSCGVHTENRICENNHNILQGTNTEAGEHSVGSTCLNPLDATQKSFRTCVPVCELMKETLDTLLLHTGVYFPQNCCFMAAPLWHLSNPPVWILRELAVHESVWMCIFFYTARLKKKHEYVSIYCKTERGEGQS